MLVEEGEVEVGQGERLDVVEGGKVGQNPCEGIWDDPFGPFVVLFLSEVQRTNVATAHPQAGAEPGLEVGEGVQLDRGEEVATAPMNPVDRDEGTGEKALGVTTESVDHFFDELERDVWYDHCGMGVEGRRRGNGTGWEPERVPAGRA